MGLRKDFLVHKNKTVESFGFVREDISRLNASIENLKGLAADAGLRISNTDNGVLNLRRDIEKCTADISVQHSNFVSLNSKIYQITGPINNALDSMKFLKNRVDVFSSRIAANNKNVLRKLSSHEKSIREIVAKSRQQASNNKKLNSMLNESVIEAKKLRNYLNRRLRTVNKKEKELETKLKSQRKTISVLGNKLKRQKVIRKLLTKKTVRKKGMPRKTIKKIITPTKIVTETVTPIKK